MSDAMKAARPTYPRKPIALLSGQRNGELSPDKLVKTLARGLLMNPVSARKFNALQATAIKQGIPLTSTGDYRLLSTQLNGLLTRYDLGYFPGRADYNEYEGQTYSLKPGKNQVATPGKSEHGWGRARDWAVTVKGRVIALRPSDKRWLAANAPRFGIFFPVASEDWHAEDYAGDVWELCPGVLEYETGAVGSHVPQFNPAKGLFSLYPLNDAHPSLRLTVPRYKSDLVAYLQGVLLKAGYPVAVDGDFGPQTDKYVREFQEAQGLKVDGLVGPHTWRKVNAFAQK